MTLTAASIVLTILGGLMVLVPTLMSLRLKPDLTVGFDGQMDELVSYMATTRRLAVITACGIGLQVVGAVLGLAALAD